MLSHLILETYSNDLELKFLKIVSRILFSIVYVDDAASLGELVRVPNTHRSVQDMSK